LPFWFDSSETIREQTDYEINKDRCAQSHQYNVLEYQS
jgi:hypothetical protein